MNSIEAMYKRRSIRKYQDKRVEKEKIDALLKAAMAAPSAHNSRPWHFVVIDDEKKIKAIYDFYKYGKIKAPLAIAVCGNMDNHYKETVALYWVQDCTAALMNMLNAAPELDLGTVWLGTYPQQHRVDFLKDLLSLPENIIPLAVFYVGYPDQERDARTQYEAEKISYNNMEK